MSDVGLTLSCSFKDINVIGKWSTLLGVDTDHLSWALSIDHGLTNYKLSLFDAQASTEASYLFNEAFMSKKVEKPNKKDPRDGFHNINVVSYIKGGLSRAGLIGFRVYFESKLIVDTLVTEEAWVNLKPVYSKMGAQTAATLYPAGGFLFFGKNLKASLQEAAFWRFPLKSVQIKDLNNMNLDCVVTDVLEDFKVCHGSETFHFSNGIPSGVTVMGSAKGCSSTICDGQASLYAAKGTELKVNRKKKTNKSNLDIYTIVLDTCVVNFPSHPEYILKLPGNGGISVGPQGALSFLGKSFDAFLTAGKVHRISISVRLDTGYVAVLLDQQCIFLTLDMIGEKKAILGCTLTLSSKTLDAAVSLLHIKYHCLTIDELRALSKLPASSCVFWSRDYKESEVESFSRMGYPIYWALRALNQNSGSRSFAVEWILENYEELMAEHKNVVTKQATKAAVLGLVELGYPESWAEMAVAEAKFEMPKKFDKHSIAAVMQEAGVLWLMQNTPKLAKAGVPERKSFGMTIDIDSIAPDVANKGDKKESAYKLASEDEEPLNSSSSVSASLFYNPAIAHGFPAE